MAKNGYQHYLELGGIINEIDYQSALDRMLSTCVFEENTDVRSSIMQARVIAEYSGIELSHSVDRPDHRVVLYVILRNDVMPKDVKFHHSQMSDQRIFAEVLRMLGDEDSLDKLIEAHPHISFKYVRGI